MRLADIETYYDTVPRAAATVEAVGPFTLFVADPATGWQFYARPRLGGTADLTADDVRRVLDRQRERGLPPALEWVDEVTPSLLPAVRAVLAESGQEDGLEVCPLLALPPGTALAPGPGRTRVLTADDPDLPATVSAVSAGFGERDELRPHDVGRRPELIRAGLLAVVAAYDASGRVVGGGATAPRGTTTELTGIGVVPSARRRGLGSAVTATLVDAARATGVDLAFLSAGSDAAARVYERLGFERVGTACILATGS